MNFHEFPLSKETLGTTTMDGKIAEVTAGLDRPGLPRSQASGLVPRSGEKQLRTIPGDLTGRRPGTR